MDGWMDRYIYIYIFIQVYKHILYHDKKSEHNLFRLN